LDIPGERIAARVREIADGVLDAAPRKASTRRDVLVHDGYVGEAFGKPTDGMIEAVSLVARTEGLVLDPVHTGKAMAGLIDKVRQGYFTKQDRVLFIHTGGLPSVFAYAPLWSSTAVATNI